MKVCARRLALIEYRQLAGQAEVSQPAARVITIVWRSPCRQDERLQLIRALAELIERFRSHSNFGTEISHARLCRCLTRRRARFMPRHGAFRCSPVKPRAASSWYCRAPRCLGTLYDFMTKLADLEGTPHSFRLSPAGGPFQCSFCTIINGRDINPTSAWRRRVAAGLVSFGRMVSTNSSSPMTISRATAQASFGLPSGSAARAQLHLLARFGETSSANMPSLLQRSRASFCSSLSSRAMQRSNVQDTALTVSDEEETTLDLLTNTTGARPAVTYFEEVCLAESRSGCLKRDLQDKLNSISAPSGS
jgi:hypothetical protein